MPNFTRNWTQAIIHKITTTNSEIVVDCACSRKYHVSTTVSAPSSVRDQISRWSGAVVVPAGDRRGTSIVVQDAVQVLAARRTAVLATQVMCGRDRSCHHQGRQLISRQVPVLLQARPGTAAAEEGRARQFITSELQADIQLVDLICSAHPTSASTSRRTGRAIQQRRRCWKSSTVSTRRLISSRSPC